MYTNTLTWLKVEFQCCKVALQFPSCRDSSDRAPMATLTWLPWKCISCSNQSKGCHSTLPAHSSPATSTRLSHPQSSVVLAIFQWCATVYGCWGFKNLWKWWLPWPSDRAKDKARLKQTKVSWSTNKDPIGEKGWVGRRLPMPLPQCSHRYCAYSLYIYSVYILAMISSAVYSRLLRARQAAQWTAKH